MNIRILVFILIFLIFTLNLKENFEAIDKDNNYELSQDRITNECCLAEKKYIKSEKDLYGGTLDTHSVPSLADRLSLSGTFDYIITKAEGEECNKRYNMGSNKQVLFLDNNNNCARDKLGSCRNVNKECVDFVDKEYCDNYNMVWSKKPCNLPLEYKWKDRIKFELPKSEDSGEFTLFDRRA